MRCSRGIEIEQNFSDMLKTPIFRIVQPRYNSPKERSGLIRTNSFVRPLQRVPDMIFRILALGGVEVCETSRSGADALGSTNRDQCAHDGYQRTPCRSMGFPDQMSRCFLGSVGAD